MQFFLGCDEMPDEGRSVVAVSRVNPVNMVNLARSFACRHKPQQLGIPKS